MPTKAQEQIARELEGLVIGYDVMMETKRQNILTVQRLVREQPGITRREIHAKTGFSMRSVTRYLAEARKTYKKGGVETGFDQMMSLKAERFEKMKAILKVNPKIFRTQLAKELGVSRKTVISYLREYWKDK